jgi:dienelactone hydrolase
MRSRWLISLPLIALALVLPWAAAPMVSVESISTAGGAVSVCFDAYVAGRGRAMAILLPELGLRKESLSGLARYLQSSGMNVLVLDLRGHGCSGGTSPWLTDYGKGRDVSGSVTPILGDVVAVGVWARERLQPRGVVVVGHGAGGGVAMMAGQALRANATIALAPAPTPGVLAPDQPRNLLIIGGYLDDRARPEMLEWVGLHTDAFPGRVTGSHGDGSARTITYTWNDHYTLILDPAVWAAIREWAKLSLGGEEQASTITLPSPVVALGSTGLLATGLWSTLGGRVRPTRVAVHRWGLVKIYSSHAGLLIALALFILWPWAGLLPSSSLLLITIPLGWAVAPYFVGEGGPLARPMKGRAFTVSLASGYMVALAVGWLLNPVNPLLPTLPQLPPVFLYTILLLPFTIYEERVLGPMLQGRGGPWLEFGMKAISLGIMLVFTKIFAGSPYPVAPHAYWFAPALLVSCLCAALLRGGNVNPGPFKAASWAVWVSASSFYVG